MKSQEVSGIELGFYDLFLIYSANIHKLILHINKNYLPINQWKNLEQNMLLLWQEKFHGR